VQRWAQSVHYQSSFKALIDTFNQSVRGPYPNQSVIARDLFKDLID
jgi:hypothetical protein